MSTSFLIPDHMRSRLKGVTEYCHYKSYDCTYVGSMSCEGSGVPSEYNDKMSVYVKDE